MKYYKFLFSLAIIFITLTLNATAQSSLSFSSGISADVNNKLSIYHVPLSLQWKPGKKENSPFFVEADYYIPVAGKRNADAYTLNQLLPQHVNLTETIRSGIFTLAIGFRIHLYSAESKSFYLNLLPVGICSQTFKINYKNYDRQNYEVLNPDESRDFTGFVSGLAFVYNFHKTTKNMFFMLHIQSPLIAYDMNKYPVSYKTVAPLKFTYGYNFYYNKKR